MSDMADEFRALSDQRKRLRAAFGMNCPQCEIARPKAMPSILLPGQRCRVDKWLDPRPPLTDAQWSAT